MQHKSYLYFYHRTQRDVSSHIFRRVELHRPSIAHSRGRSSRILLPSRSETGKTSMREREERWKVERTQPRGTDLRPSCIAVRSVDARLPRSKDMFALCIFFLTVVVSWHAAERDGPRQIPLTREKVCNAQTNVVPSFVARPSPSRRRKMSSPHYLYRSSPFSLSSPLSRSTHRLTLLLTSVIIIT